MNNWEKVNLIGVIATSEEVKRTYDKERVFINKNNDIQFYVKIISTTPYDYPEENNKTKYVSCFSSHITEFYTDDYLKSEDERINDFIEYINDKFIILKVEQKEDYTYVNKYYYNGIIKSIAKQSEYLDRTQSLHPIPLFDRNNSIDSKNLEQFLNNIKNNKALGNIKSISTEREDVPQYIFYKDESNDINVIGEINDYEYFSLEGFNYTFSDEIKYIKLNDEDYKSLIETDYNIVYISTELSQTIEKRLHQEKNNLINMKDKEKKRDDQKTEDDFLNYLFNKLGEMKLIYKKQDILNFHTAMKTSNLVILSGMSGTGKSKLVKAYTEALKIKGSFKFIPVSPSWTDDTDIIGYADTLNMIYRPDDHGLVDILISASEKENENKLYIICLDEMNLARIEHYFSQFLSILESDGDNRKLTLYNKELGGKLYNSTKYKHEIPIGKNVRFVGTANIDDTTYHFSNKVLDRANLINLKVMPFKELVDVTRNEKVIFKTDTDFANKYIESFVNNDKSITLDSKVIEFIQEFHDLLVNISNQFGIGPRVVKQIDLYIKNIPNNQEEFTIKEGLDLQIVQRVLTKLRGSSEELIELIGLYDIKSKEVHSSQLIDLIEKYNDISEFKETKMQILAKAKELYLNGYTF
ncbi:McrB family protein [Staphylococcus borealis]|uniref:McrB family protein n=1 Tax=Staphylococcus borealis TaxID=2742203 RepID=UPI00374EB69D